jgi:chromosome segregation ATPase
MAINVKKYTKDQMAKMVEEAQAEVQELRRGNAALTEQISQMNGEGINKANEIANLKADLDASKAASKLLNDQGQQYWRAWQASKREVADLKNKLNDTEAALGRANACIATMQVEKDQQTKDCFEWQRSAQNLHDDLLNARERANYAEAHPWRNLWAWVKRKMVRHE